MFALRSVAADEEGTARRECGSPVRASKGRGEAGECDSRRHGFWRGGGEDEREEARLGRICEGWGAPVCWLGTYRDGGRLARLSVRSRIRPSSHFCHSSPASALSSSHCSQHVSQPSCPHHRRVQVHCYPSRIPRARWLRRCPRGLGLAATKILLTEFDAKVVALSRSETVELTELRKHHADSLLLAKGDVLVLWSLRSASILAPRIQHGQSHRRLCGRLRSANIWSPRRSHSQCRDPDAFGEGGRGSSRGLEIALRCQLLLFDIRCASWSATPAKERARWSHYIR